MLPTNSLITIADDPSNFKGKGVGGGKVVRKVVRKVEEGWEAVVGSLRFMYSRHAFLSSVNNNVESCHPGYNQDSPPILKIRPTCIATP